MWRPAASALPSHFEHRILLACAPTRVMAAFIDPHALAVWWLASRSVVAARPMGVYAIEWEPTVERDEVLGRLGGIFHGTVMAYSPGREFFVADAWWLPPDGEPLGPMALEVRCGMDGPACRLSVRQSGFEEGPRWRSYYNVISQGWVSSLTALKHYVETMSCG